MEKEIYRMLEECKMRYHLKALMPDIPFIVAFDNGVEKKRVSFGKHNEIDMINETDCESDFIVKGNPEQICTLLDGKEKLSILLGREDIAVTGTYRGLLFVESVLTLCRIHEAEPVVI
ncbi:hypothetical protein D3H55_00610 [Bacillus salacetis]|uniref:SCP2 domain-containing protein n=1 Tax=Bacillus salacetis TaxID=2315464 RepID=A0A3A1R722_9BACI|nr:hypothetical protein [Bacillus salacetis]RIW38892.1 hypothetical protein D3H55_00610 [Bacillus salacetis]